MNMKWTLPTMKTTFTVPAIFTDAKALQFLGQPRIKEQEKLLEKKYTSAAEVMEKMGITDQTFRSNTSILRKAYATLAQSKIKSIRSDKMLISYKVNGETFYKIVRRR